MSILDEGSQFPRPSGRGRAGTAVARRLSLQVEKQEYDQWCWAAVAVSVSRHYEQQGSAWTQCDLVDRELHKAVCCQDGDSCNTSWYLERALQRVKHYHACHKCNLKDSQFPLLKSEIDSGRIPCVRVLWRGSSAGHFLAITGYTVTDPGGHNSQYLDISDPRDGQGVKTLAYWDLMLRYRIIGTWTHTYLTS